MPELVSLEAAKVAAGSKLNNNEALGRLQVISLSSPAAAAWAQDDTLASPVDIPVGSRIVGYKVRNEAFGASVVLDIGLRASLSVDAAQTVIDVDGIADGIDISAAAENDDCSGAAGVLVDVGTNTIYRTAQVSNVYATFAGADPTDDAQIRIDVIVALGG